MELKKLKSFDLTQQDKFDFIFPIGATEQHGPFLPFGTDTYITDYIITETSKNFPEMIVLPILEVSRSQEHKGFYGTIRLSEETLERVMYDVCNSLKDKARNIFIYSFHANEVYIQRFIQKYNFDDVTIICLSESEDEDCEYIEKEILHGPLDGHAGNSEISNMLYIDKTLVQIPPSNYPKIQVDDHFSTDDLLDKSADGIADNHTKRIISDKIGKEILDIYVDRITKNIRTYVG